MPLLEDVKAVGPTRMTGIARPGTRGAQALVQMRKPVRYRFKDDGRGTEQSRFCQGCCSTGGA